VSDPFSRARGLDLSVYQGDVDFEKIFAAGYAWVTLKATEGTRHVDRNWEKNQLAARRAGLLIEAYHFMSPDMPIDIQIDHFARTTIGLTDLPPVLDFESPPPEQWKLGQATELIANALRAVQMIEESFGLVGSAVYSYPFFLRSLPKTPALEELATRRLWLASYSNQKVEPKESEWPIAPLPWQRPLFWQWSGDQGLPAPGVSTIVDHNLFDGTVDELWGLVITTSEVFKNPDGDVSA
jgi:lysozyme